MEIDKNLINDLEKYLKNDFIKDVLNFNTGLFNMTERFNSKKEFTTLNNFYNKLNIIKKKNKSKDFKVYPNENNSKMLILKKIIKENNIDKELTELFIFPINTINNYFIYINNDKFKNYIFYRTNDLENGQIAHIILYSTKFDEEFMNNNLKENVLLNNIYYKEYNKNYNIIINIDFLTFKNKLYTNTFDDAITYIKKERNDIINKKNNEQIKIDRKIEIIKDLEKNINRFKNNNNNKLSLDIN